jgi:organic radical activating enzyme
MTIPQIVNKLKTIQSTFPSKWVCLTGGEPLLQPLEGLIRNLRTQGFKIQIETNATLFRRLEVDWYTISPKPPDYFYQPAYKKRAKEVKIVVTRGLVLDALLKLRKEFPLKIPLLLQPQSNTLWSGKLALKLLRQAAKEDLSNIRVTAQLQKIFDWR